MNRINCAKKRSLKIDERQRRADSLWIEAIKAGMFYGELSVLADATNEAIEKAIEPCKKCTSLGKYFYMGNPEKCQLELDSEKKQSHEYISDGHGTIRC